MNLIKKKLGHGMIKITGMVIVNKVNSNLRLKSIIVWLYKNLTISLISNIIVLMGHSLCLMVKKFNYKVNLVIYYLVLTSNKNKSIMPIKLISNSQQNILEPMVKSKYIILLILVKN